MEISNMPHSKWTLTYPSCSYRTHQLMMILVSFSPIYPHPTMENFEANSRKSITLSINISESISTTGIFCTHSPGPFLALGTSACPAILWVPTFFHRIPLLLIFPELSMSLATEEWDLIKDLWWKPYDGGTVKGTPRTTLKIQDTC